MVMVTAVVQAERWVGTGCVVEWEEVEAEVRRLRGLGLQTSMANMLPPMCSHPAVACYPLCISWPSEPPLQFHHPNLWTC